MRLIIFLILLIVVLWGCAEESSPAAVGAVPDTLAAAWTYTGTTITQWIRRLYKMLMRR